MIGEEQVLIVVLRWKKEGIHVLFHHLLVM